MRCVSPDPSIIPAGGYLERRNAAGEPLRLSHEVRDIAGQSALLYQLVHRDLTVRYKRSVLGLVWTMLHPLLLMLIFVVALALAFDFSNGWHDSANAIATVVSTHVLSPARAVLLAAVLNIAGAFMSTAVAKMIGGGIVEAALINQATVAAALIGAIAGGGKGVLIGGPVGAGAGVATAFITGKKDVRLPPETHLTFRLSQPVTITTKS